MALFSERLGYKTRRSVLQTEEANEELRIAVYNALYLVFGDSPKGAGYDAICKDIWSRLWHQPISSFPYYYYEFYERLLSYLKGCQWYEVYDLLDFVLDDINELVEGFEKMGYADFRFENSPLGYAAEEINDALESEGSGYRAIGSHIVPITNEQEIETIEAAIDNVAAPDGVPYYLNCALGKLSERPRPDCRNAVKEAIQAVESMAKSIVGEKYNTLGKALTKLKESKSVPTLLIESWEKLNGFSNYSSSGIRHSGAHAPNEPNQALAKYMIVTCSAFINYLLEEFGQDEQR